MLKAQLQEVELRISTFTLRQSDQEFLASGQCWSWLRNLKAGAMSGTIASDELRCQLDDVRVHRRLEPNSERAFQGLRLYVSFAGS